MNTYRVGNTVKLSANCSKLDPNGQWIAVNPDTVTLLIQQIGQPAMVVNGIQNPVVGSFYVLWPAMVVGKFVYQFTGTGNCVCEGDGMFIVRDRAIVK